MEFLKDEEFRITGERVSRERWDEKRRYAEQVRAHCAMLRDAATRKNCQRHLTTVERWINDKADRRLVDDMPPVIEENATI
jgi:hypothetical protein